MSGWMMSSFLEGLDPSTQTDLKQRAVSGLDGTFAIDYARTIALAELLTPRTLAQAARRTSGGKLLVDPTI